jgi:hypothetical protein
MAQIALLGVSVYRQVGGKRFSCAQTVRISGNKDWDTVIWIKVGAAKEYHWAFFKLPFAITPFASDFPSGCILCCD